ncbi:MAG: tetratricopeptide repeat protein [Paludibacteraceae bacterium]|nr:tetratricopeptide repeat protein [Paludibacteraceae bacterium]
MKRTLFFAALVLISAGCFAQKNPAIKKAKSYMLASENPDFAAARASISEALKTEQTAEAYYWAGMIGCKELESENYNQLLGKGFDQAKAGKAVIESYNYWLIADSLAMIPTLDKKGREVVDQKTRNNIVKNMMEYYKNQELVKYGIHLNEQKDYVGAYNAFYKHITMRDLPMMQSDKLQKEMPKDTTYTQYKYYTAIFAVQSEMHQEAIALLEEMKDGDYEGIAVNQFLYQEYVALKDTAKFVATLQSAIERFPSEPWFLQNLINYYLFSNQQQTAIDYLSKAIEREPNVAQYHLIKGNLNANNNNFEEALKDFENALAIDPKMADAVAGKGRVYYNKAYKMNEDAAMISDNKAYKKALAEMNEEYKKSMPFFEQAHELNPKERDYMIVLKSLYYRFRNEPGMQAKYDAMVEKINNL